MTDEQLRHRLSQLRDQRLPLTGQGGAAPARHHRLIEIGREDLSLAKLIEAHWDAVSILAEAGREAVPGALYGVWASEIPGAALHLQPAGDGFLLQGRKRFCSGAGIVDRSLISVGDTARRLVDMDLRTFAGTLILDGSEWKTDAFRQTQTATVCFNGTPVSATTLVGGPEWYVERSGFWHGACGPAACWAGGAAGLLDYALQNKRSDAHTIAHLGAMHANQWAMEAALERAGREIDEAFDDARAAQLRALSVRHVVEQACMDTMQRFARAYGPYPLAMNANISRRYHELELYIRQSHAERDLYALGTAIKKL